METLIIPTIEIHPRLTPDNRDALSQLEDYDWIFLTSANTVRIAAGLFAEAHARFPEATRVCCVGTSTAEACRHEAWPVHLIPDEFRAEGVLSALQSRYPDGLEGISVLLPQSRQARPTLREGLLREPGLVRQAVGARVPRT